MSQQEPQSSGKENREAVEVLTQQMLRAVDEKLKKYDELMKACEIMVCFFADTVDMWDARELGIEQYRDKMRYSFSIFNRLYNKILRKLRLGGWL